MSTPFAIAVRCAQSQLLLFGRTINQGASLAVVTNWLTLWLAVVAVRFQKPHVNEEARYLAGRRETSAIAACDAGETLQPD